MTPLLGPGSFAGFYRAVHGRDPFPWQRMLAERVLRDGWPSCIDLPTASGKTSCIEVAVFTLACQADLPPDRRTSPRRVFFVVDRRIVVDGAFDHARELANKLRVAENGILRAVADRLRSLAPDRGPAAEPLFVTRMRGAIALDDGWVRDPRQPAVITSTVDQLGSRLLFRGYGRSGRVAAIDAALSGNDALIILDEAHCSVPFSQTLHAVQQYRSDRWAERPIRSPFATVVMSATPPDGIEPDEIFPAPDQRAAALGGEELERRLKAVKRTELAIARKPPEPKHGAPGLPLEARLSDDALALDAADRAIKFAAAGPRRIAVMVNRVATARAIARQLEVAFSSAESRPTADVVLLTGRMRPLDRDRLVEAWRDRLTAKSEPVPIDRPIVVVTTQCLEVGADFSFDVLITECASLDALRQRFGRLDRLGRSDRVEAVILIRPEQVKTPAQLEALAKSGKLDDPIYGNALAATWNWLNEHATDAGGKGSSRWIDMGVGSVDSHLPPTRTERRGALGRLAAPTADAPVLLPVHLDFLAQTSPHPSPDPDVSLFLHGPERGTPEVSVVYRLDLGVVPEGKDVDGRDHPWLQAVSLLPPTSVEAFPVPLRLVREWMAAGRADDSGVHDVEAPLPKSDEPAPTGRRYVVRWRGRDDSTRTANPDLVRPGDIVVIPGVVEFPSAFGEVPPGKDGRRALDVAEEAYQAARDQVVLRVNSAVLAPWAARVAVKALLEWSAVPDRDTNRENLEELLSALDQEAGPDAEVPPLPDWLRIAGRVLAAGCDIAPHPCGGYVLSSRRRLGRRARERDAFEDTDDLTSAAHRPAGLRSHLAAAAAAGRGYAEGCLPPELVAPVVRALELHDVGKIDPRFQQVLHGGNLLAALAEPEPLAKSVHMPTSRRARQRARELAGLPRRFRHELLSVQLTERYCELPDDPSPRDLVLHLIATHHGYTRPFAPVVEDDEPPTLDAWLDGLRFNVAAEERRGWSPAHSLESGIADRFGRLLRRYGWWGLALLEAVVRLADWTASETAEAQVEEEAMAPAVAGMEGT